ncbi:hypothetical protein QR680_017896 [Steinernema hermaphroditum]|uniref:Uncharacterized protein n=1 Tax=Steinernema hermaphroditum TaxID=289476 RepID=A0AA39HG78_9BILA|nr:hypothetical protein QR680_017896 [Steinernema hermaphroditum]
MLAICLFGYLRMKLHSCMKKIWYLLVLLFCVCMYISLPDDNATEKERETWNMVVTYCSGVLVQTMLMLFLLGAMVLEDLFPTSQKKELQIYGELIRGIRRQDEKQSETGFFLLTVCYITVFSTALVYKLREIE